MGIRNQRAEVLAGNLANADTPGFKARDLDFDIAFKQAAHVQMQQPSEMVKLMINIWMNHLFLMNLS